MSKGYDVPMKPTAKTFPDLCDYEGDAVDMARLREMLAGCGLHVVGEASSGLRATRA